MIPKCTDKVVVIIEVCDKENGAITCHYGMLCKVTYSIVIVLRNSDVIGLKIP